MTDRVGGTGGWGRSAAWLALFAVIAGLWAATIGMSTSMDGSMMDGAMMDGPAMDRPAMDGAMAPPSSGGMPMPADGMGGMRGERPMPGMDGMAGGTAMAPPGFGALLPMWLVMMAAMMLPVMVPTLAAYETLIRTANATRAGWLGVMGGYLGVWLGAAVVLSAVQGGLAQAGLVTGMGAARGAWFAAALLLAAGLWQFTALKETCQGICLAPTAWFLGRWRTGAAGGARMGAGLGAVCVACCWGYMALGFVGGTMSMLWMAGATCLMILEKLPQVGRHLRRPVGAAMLAAGAAWPFV